MFRSKLYILIFLLSFNCLADKNVILNYANIAEGKYSDSLHLAKSMLDKINAFLNYTTENNFEAVKTSWLEARKVYQQTEVFRFGNPIVDDWEGKVNAWPLDEGLIDYD